jgi:hypothetical protein
VTARRVPTLSVVRRPRADLDVGALRLQGSGLPVKLRNSITDASIDETIDGASTLTLTVNDWGKTLLQSEAAQSAATLTFDGLSFTLVKISRQQDATTLTFEETAVNLLRRYSKPRKANRANTTRAQFVRSMVREVKEARIPFECPEVNKRQPIASK